MKHLDLFSGIGGFALAVDTVWPGSEHIFCDNDNFCQKVLKKHWPNSYIHGDIRTLTYPIKPGARSEGEPSGYEGGGTGEGGREGVQAHWETGTGGVEPADRVFILTGGFPCQPFSNAGRRKGTEDDRHLWPEMLRVIREFRPRWVIGENVAGLLTLGEGVVFEQVCSELEAEGYEVQAFIIPACALNAPHRRDRIWIVANTLDGRQRRKKQRINGASDGVPQEYREKDGTSGKPERTVGDGETLRHAPDTDARRLRRYEQKGTQERPIARGRSEWDENWLEVATRLCTLDDGLPDGLARPRGWRNAALKAAGNAIVPQVAIEIMRAIKEVSPNPLNTPGVWTTGQSG